ncbi:hypothetical protein FGF1_03870 [Flavobacteriaceae bacterium GF1]
MDSISERLKLIMDDNNLVIRTLAIKIGVSDVMMGKYVNGKSMPGFEVLQSIINAFPNINSHWLLTGEGPHLDSGNSRLKVLNDYSPIEMVDSIEDRIDEFKKEPSFLRMVDRVAREHGLIEELIKEVAQYRKEVQKLTKG